MPDYVEIAAILPVTEQEALAEALSDIAVLGAVVEPRKDGMIRVGVWAPAGDETRLVEVRAMLEALGGLGTTIHEHEAADWCAGWRESLRPFSVGDRWWVDPHPDRPSPAPAGRIRLAVEPRAAFGSGTHESTRLVLIELEARGCRGLDVLDLGTGSGVLAVASALLDAEAVLALDIDPTAAFEARFTASAQPVPCPLRIVAGGIDSLGDSLFDLVLCNMTVSELAPLVEDMVRVSVPGGSLVLSGILASERAQVESVLIGHGLERCTVRELGEWISVAARRPERHA